MSMGRFLYKTTMRAARPFLGSLLRRRAKRGKENAERIAERFAHPDMDLTPAHLVWMHGASIGETRLLLEVAERLGAKDVNLHFLFTSQTQTAAELINRHITSSETLRERSRYQVAPLDTPDIAARFLDNWQPILCIFAEGEIWPNLILEASSRKIPLALINARMTAKSMKGWTSWRGFAREVFSSFDTIVAADQQTAEGLGKLACAHVPCPGSLKLSISVREINETEAQAIRNAFVGGRRCLVAVSTHEGEEGWILDAVAGIEPRPALIIIPRHPERRDAIESLLKDRGLTFSVRSRGETPTTADDVLLCDTLGEVALLASVADSVYLGGGHAHGVGGHNPVEILRIGKPVFTGPRIHNFADLATRLEGDTSFQIVRDQEALRQAFPLPPPSHALKASLEAQAETPMRVTLEALDRLLGQTTT
ncbi:3-deoxy-D-manno-octulosonic acid transferase [Henriciella barbarensis]|uniref:3-deoxy-D-manno-octulosonic acid transferase n=1 Tax=Henriciella barbarensis TaxID=86342 RepID=A0A399QTD7_9PROT|nr:glycosyltransferase N-terminal domain-containing protein [Henriciella barbarensis]RIJ22108.1 3-deoxy-D-manno-octulosonic acid transferase [Henriciella barbarensis]